MSTTGVTAGATSTHGQRVHARSAGFWADWRTVALRALRLTWRDPEAFGPADAARVRAEIALDDDLAGPSSVLADDTGIYVRDRGGARLRRFPKGAGAALVLYERAPEPD